MASCSEALLDIRLLGGFSVRTPKGDLVSRLPRATHMWTLLQILLLSGPRPVAADTLIDAIWPGEESENPGAALQSLVYRLRGVLDADFAEKQDFILFSGGSYRWNLLAPASTDIRRFEDAVHSAEALEKSAARRAEDLCRCAVAEYRGDLLPARASDSWCVGAAPYYRQLFERCVCELCRLRSDAGDWTDVLNIAKQALKLDYYAEDFHYFALTAMARLDRYTDARTHYDQYTAALRREFGVQPSPTLIGRLRTVFPGPQTVSGANVKDILHELQRGRQPGALFCDLPTFSTVVSLYSRLAERSGAPLSLVCLDFTKANDDPIEDPALGEAIVRRLHTSIGCLRRCDAAAEYLTGRFLLLLSSTAAEQTGCVEERFRALFFAKPAPDCILRWSSTDVVRAD